MARDYLFNAVYALAGQYVPDKDAIGTLGSEPLRFRYTAKDSALGVKVRMETPDRLRMFSHEVGKTDVFRGQHLIISQDDDRLEGSASKLPGVFVFHQNDRASPELLQALQSVGYPFLPLELLRQALGMLNDKAEMPFVFEG